METNPPNIGNPWGGYWPTGIGIYSDEYPAKTVNKRPPDEEIKRPPDEEIKGFVRYAPHGDFQAEVTFPNGYGASIVRHKFSYGGNRGLFEIAVLRDGEIVFDTPITNDVIGWCDPDQVDDYLNKIRVLPDYKEK